MKQETLEEAAELATNNPDLTWENKYAKEKFIEGAKWQAENLYSEEDMIEFHKWAYQKNRTNESDKTTKELLTEWFKKFKKK